MGARTRVLVADDHPLIRAGIRATLSAEPDIEIVDEAKDGHGASRLSIAYCPDVLLLDLNMPGPSPAGTIATVQKECSDINVVVLVPRESRSCIHSAVTAGAVGALLKDVAVKTLVEAVRTVSRGGTWFSKSVMAKLVRTGNGRAIGPQDYGLTPRELEVLNLVSKGLSNREIAGELDVAERTVEFHITNILRKLGTTSRVKAAIVAKEQLLTSS